MTRGSLPSCLGRGQFMVMPRTPGSLTSCSGRASESLAAWSTPTHPEGTGRMTGLPKVCVKLGSG
eukprot:5719939-Alexandrium_andersonii.AAC.1